MDKTDLPGDRVKKIRVKRPYVKSRKAYQREYRARRASEKRRERDIITGSKEEILAILGAVIEKVDIILREQAVIKLNMAVPHLRTTPPIPRGGPVPPLRNTVVDPKPMDISTVMTPEELERARQAAIEAAAEEEAERQKEAIEMACMAIPTTIHIPHVTQNGHLREEPPAPRLIP